MVDNWVAALPATSDTFAVMVYVVPSTNCRKLLPEIVIITLLLLTVPV